MAAGEDGPRAAVEAELAELEEGGWMLRGPVARLWAGERGRDALVAGLDEQDTRLIERALELALAYERGELRTPSHVLADLPEAVRAALEQGDAPALQAALDALPVAEQARAAALLDELQGAPGGTAAPAAPPAPASGGRAAPPADLPEAVRAALEQGDAPALQAALDALPVAERNALVEQLRRAGVIRTEARPRPDMDRVIQQFLPLLGDIALAAHGDETARLLAEAMLPGLEQRGWRLADAARRIWAGERDAAALTEGLDEQDSALVQQIMRLVGGGRELIAIAGSLRIARLRREAGEAAAQACAAGPQECEALAAQLESLAEQAEGQPGAPWQGLAAQLRELAGAAARGVAQRRSGREKGHGAPGPHGERCDALPHRTTSIPPLSPMRRGDQVCLCCVQKDLCCQDMKLFWSILTSIAMSS